MLITSLDNPKIKLLEKLKTSKYRKKEKLFIAEGAHLVDEAKKAGVLVEAYSLDEKEGYIQITKQIMDKIADTDTTVSEIGLCKMLEKTELSSRVLILDAIQDPGNMGALMRSANAFGFKTFILGTGCVDIYNSKAVRSSQGAIFKLNFINTDIPSYLDNLKDYKIYGTDVVNGVELDSVEVTDKIAFVLGNEGNGVSEEVKAKMEKNIYIPMNNTESLNVSVAGSIIMYKLRG